MMNYEKGKPISELLSEFLLKHTSEKDVELVRSKFEKPKSNSLVLKLRQGRYVVNDETEKYLKKLYAIALKNYSKEREKFKELVEPETAA